METNQFHNRRSIDTQHQLKRHDFKAEKYENMATLYNGHQTGTLLQNALKTCFKKPKTFRNQNTCHKPSS